MDLSEIVFIKDKELPGGEVLLCTKSPFNIGRAFRFEHPEHLNNFLLKYNLNGSVGTIPGYNIIICHIGNIYGINENVILGHNVTPTTLTTLQNMAFYYEKERIKGNETRLKIYAR